MKKLINDLKHLVNPVNPVKNIKKRNEPKLTDPRQVILSGTKDLIVQNKANFYTFCGICEILSSNEVKECGFKIQNKPKYALFNRKSKIENRQYAKQTHLTDDNNRVKYK